MKIYLIAKKLSHSFSPEIHRHLADYSYELKELEEDELKSFFEKRQFDGLNVTVPYKTAVMKYLDFISPEAEKIGAVNTIVNRGGRLYGYNTDFSGLTALINRTGITLKGKKVLILGSGGTSKTALCVATTLGADSVYRVSRNGGEELITYAQAENEHNDAEIIINTTPCGMYPNIGEAAIDIGKFPKLSGVVDAVYNPLNSALICEAKERGIPAAGGLYMLVSQAVFAAEKFTGTEIPQTETERVFNKLLLSKRNLVLIGMPGCGKTTIGKRIAQELNMEFCDSDDGIVKKAGISISEFFEKYGEKDFRLLESEVIAQLSLKQNQVIATGGGAILNKRNIDLLKENGIVIFIDRPLEQLVTTDDRPLSSNRELLERRYNERYHIYCSLADCIVEADKDLEHNINSVKEMFLNENSCN